MIQIPIPVEAFADCGAILGRRGAGKSGTGRGILEHELDRGHRCCVIDPKGDWYGIRATKDGEPSRFEIPVFGGAHADVPITDDMGQALGAIVATSSTSCVIDLSGFSVAGMRRFMTAFAEALFYNNRNPLTLFVDEADQLAPQRVAADQAKLLHNMEMLIRQGRQRGIFMWMLTQRPAVINKNLLSQAETLIAMKMTGPQDRAAIRDWMDAHDPEKSAVVEKTLAKLTVGQAWAWVPGQDFLEQVQFPMFETYDSGRTPKHGEVYQGLELKPLDVAELAKLLNGGESEQETDLLDLARMEIDRLKRRQESLIAQLAEAKAQRDTAVSTLTRAQDVIGMAIGSPRMHALPAGQDPTGWIMALDGHEEARPINAPTAHLAAVNAGVRRMRTAIEHDGGSTTLDPERAMVEGGQIVAKMGKAAVQILEGLQPAQRKIIQAIAAGKGTPMPRTEIARLAGISPTSSNVGAKLTAMSGNGLIELVNGDLFSFIGHRQ
jgi:hypothetical protein